jgi:1,4-alpha-glucan branching enzyme
MKGYNEQWLNESNGWTWRHVHVAGERMVELARRYGGSTNPLLDRGAEAGGP